MDRRRGMPSPPSGRAASAEAVSTQHGKCFRIKLIAAAGGMFHPFNHFVTLRGLRLTEVSSGQEDSAQRGRPPSAFSRTKKRYTVSVLKMDSMGCAETR